MPGRPACQGRANKMLFSGGKLGQFIRKLFLKVSRVLVKNAPLPTHIKRQLLLVTPSLGLPEKQKSGPPFSPGIADFKEHVGVISGEVRNDQRCLLNATSDLRED